MSFSRQARLVTKAEFDSLFDKTSSFKLSQKNLLALYKPNQKTFARIGIIAGKRVLNQASQRNEFKRIVRESFRAVQDELKGFDIIIVARQHDEPLDKNQLRKGIDKLWLTLISRFQKA